MYPTQSTMFAGLESVAGQAFSGKVIYETKGRAREYRELACNLFTGCDHGCLYCYAPDVMHRDRKAFQRPSPRKGIIHKLRRDAEGYGRSGEQRQILFCFTCDPYQRFDEELGITRKAIEICHENGLAISTLTKGGSRALRDLDLFTDQDSFATSLTLLDEAESRKWEPGAASPQERISVMKTFYDAGIPTWVSLEPVIDPFATMDMIRQTHSFVDEYKVGIMNYHPIGKRIDWARFGREVVALLESLGCSYYLKHDLRKYLM